ncbi:Uncharacterised protein [Bordetella pertussis]|nr:Uncharacterised protein [Bordetella pertussis]
MPSPLVSSQVGRSPARAQSRRRWRPSCAQGAGRRR